MSEQRQANLEADRIIAEGLAAENERLKDALKKIAAEDYRGNRPWSAGVAERALRDA